MKILLVSIFWIWTLLNILKSFRPRCQCLLNVTYCELFKRLTETYLLCNHKVLSQMICWAALSLHRIQRYLDRMSTIQHASFQQTWSTKDDEEKNCLQKTSPWEYRNTCWSLYPRSRIFLCCWPHETSEIDSLWTLLAIHICFVSQFQWMTSLSLQAGSWWEEVKSTDYLLTDEFLLFSDDHRFQEDTSIADPIVGCSRVPDHLPEHHNMGRLSTCNEDLHHLASGNWSHIWQAYLKSNITRYVQYNLILVPFM